MSDQASVETAARLLKELSESDEVTIGAFFSALGEGMFNEWDCSLSTAFDQFGEGEFKVALKSAAGTADFWVSQFTTIEGSVAECGKPLVQGGTDAFCTQPLGHDGGCVWCP